MDGASTRYALRMARPEDVAELARVDAEAWGDEAAAMEQTIARRIQDYPLGNYVAVAPDGTIAGWVCTVATQPQALTTWQKATGNGVYENCDFYGPCVYGVNLSVRKDHLGNGIGTKLVQRVIEVAWVTGREIFQLGARIPYFHLWKGVFTGADYVWLLKDARGHLFYRNPETHKLHEGPCEGDFPKDVLVDPRTWPVVANTPLGLKVFDAELRFFLNITAFPGTKFETRAQLKGVLPDYFPDPDSDNNGALVEWQNTPAYLYL